MLVIDNNKDLKEYTKMLFPHAFKILRIHQDAEDAVQDSLSNYFSNERGGIENIKGYLVKSVINQSINIKNKRKRVSYADVWPAEPVTSEEADNNINLSEIASYSLRILMEKLNPRERAVFILKEAFGYSHQEIADLISGSIELSRQLLTRGKNKLSSAGHKSKKTIRDVVPESSLNNYVQAIRDRDAAIMEHLLLSDIAFSDNDNRKVEKKRRPCYGEISELLFFVYQKFLITYKIYATKISHQFHCVSITSRIADSYYQTIIIGMVRFQE